MDSDAPFKSLDKAKNCFVMMRYRDHPKLGEIENVIREALDKHGVEAKLAKEGTGSSLLWANVCAFMDRAKFGVAIFDNVATYKPGEARANPNICMELGYMLARGADCLILRDVAGYEDANGRLFTDLDGHIVQTIDTSRDTADLAAVVSKWIQQRVRVGPIYDGFAQMFPKSKIADRIKEQPQEKLAIAHDLIKHWIKYDMIPESLLLDSGTTAAAVAEAVMLHAEAFAGTEIYTNNLLVSFMLSSIASLRCHVLGGVVDHTYACVFATPPRDAFPKKRIDVAVVSCTGFSKKRGPMANSPPNREFKQVAMELCRHTYLVFGSDKTNTRGGKPVFDNARVWHDMLKNKVKQVITDNRHGRQLLGALSDEKLKLVDPKTAL